jgi:hypothetical protein
MVLLIGYSLLMWVFTSSVWGLGGYFWSSWIAFAFVYLGTAIFLRINGVSSAESFVISLASTVSMVWLYEVLYHFSFWNAWNYGYSPYFLLKGNAIFLNYALISLTAFAGYKYMKANRWFWLVLIAMSALWIFWITIGFPQYPFPQTLYVFAWPIIVINNPHALALPLNAITKLLLSTAYILLYLPSTQKFSLAKEDIKRFLIKRGLLDYNDNSQTPLPKN